MFELLQINYIIYTIADTPQQKGQILWGCGMSLTKELFLKGGMLMTKELIDQILKDIGLEKIIFEPDGTRRENLTEKKD